MAQLDGFRHFTFSHDGKARQVFTRGEGPGVIIMHEIPGITPEVVSFARRVADAGFFVAMPRLFGDVGRRLSVSYSLREMASACVRREFAVWSSHRSSPITDWLRALCREVHGQRGGPGVGAVGMCITGNFALALMVDEALMAPILSQPSLPFAVGKERRAALHISEDALAIIKRRCGNDPELKIIGLRFSGDPMCPPARFATLQREFGEHFEAHEIPSEMANPAGPPVAHSVLTSHLVDEDGHPTRAALDRVISYLTERLIGTS